MTIRIKNGPRNILLIVVALTLSAGCSSGRSIHKACTGTPAEFKLKIKLNKDGSPKEVRHDYLLGSKADKIEVCPGDSVRWRQHNKKSFSIGFATTSPFSSPILVSAPEPGGVEKVLDTILTDSPDGEYKYTVTVTVPGTPNPVLDPIIIVDR